MKKAYVISIFCALLFLFVSGSALADEEWGPGPWLEGSPECDALQPGDPERAAIERPTRTARLETARQILRVNARRRRRRAETMTIITQPLTAGHVNGSGETGVGYDGAVYKETTLSNFGREEMWLYLDKIFNWSSDMELIIYDELWETYPDDGMTYMLVNKWFGTADSGFYEQPGISIVKFRPGEGCAAYQRDYFSEGDTWFGMSFANEMIVERRGRIISELGLTDKCVDDDGDGFTKYAEAAGCDEGAVVDCDDYHADIHPVDDDGDGYFAVTGRVRVMTVTMGMKRSIPVPPK